MIDGTDGEILAKPDALGYYSASLVGVDDDGRTAEVWRWEFEVVQSPKFRLSSNWHNDVERDPNIRPKYRLDKVYVISAPSIARSKLFISPAGNDSAAVSFVLRIFSGSSVRNMEHRVPNVRRKLSEPKGSQEPQRGAEERTLLCPGERCPGQYFVAQSGLISIMTSLQGDYTAELDAVDKSGARVTVRAWSFQALPDDTTDPFNGPNGRGCGDGVAVDVVEFDKAFTCACNTTRFEGSNCDRELLNVKSSDDTDHRSAIAWGIVALLISLAVVGLVIVRLRVRHLERKARDFQAIAQELRNTGELSNIVDGEIKLPREIKRQAVTFIRKLGEGSFGEVWLGMLDERVVANGILVPAYNTAIKTSKGADDATMTDMVREATVMAQVGIHVNIVSLIGAVTAGGPPLLLLLSYCEQGSLLGILEKRKRNGARAQSTIRQMLLMMIDIANGMAHLVGCKLIHRDLAARNVLVDSAEVCKVADFGLCRGGARQQRRSFECASDDVGATENEPASDMEYQSHAGVFPVRWTCPVAMQTLVFSEASDVWSFAITAIEILTDGTRPYAKCQSNAEVRRLVIQGGRMKKPPRCPQALFSLLLRCWDEEPKSRPHFHDIVEQLTKMELEEATKTPVVLPSLNGDLSDASNTNVGVGTGNNAIPVSASESEHQATRGNYGLSENGDNKLESSPTKVERRSLNKTYGTPTNIGRPNHARDRSERPRSLNGNYGLPIRREARALDHDYGTAQGRRQQSPNRGVGLRMGANVPDTVPGSVCNTATPNYASPLPSPLPRREPTFTLADGNTSVSTESYASFAMARRSPVDSRHTSSTRTGAMAATNSKSGAVTRVINKTTGSADDTVAPAAPNVIAISKSSADWYDFGDDLEACPGNEEFMNAASSTRAPRNTMVQLSRTSKV